MDTILREVRDEVAAILGDGLKVSEVEDAMMGEFGFVHQCMNDGTLNPVRLQYIGEWSVTDRQKANHKRRKDEEEQELLKRGDTGFSPP